MNLRGMRSGPVALFEFNDLIILFISPVVASKVEDGFFLKDFCYLDYAGVISIVFNNFPNIRSNEF